MKHGLLICISCCLLLAPLSDSAVFASLSSYEASFEVIANASKQWKDVQVELKITYGENDALRRKDMKSIAVKYLKAVEVKDGGGKSLPFKISPGKKQSTIIFWDLPEGQRADQTVIIRFYLPDGITIKGGKNYFGAYWTGGGWSQPVVKAVYRFVFPPGYSYESCSVYPKYGHTEDSQDNKKLLAVSMVPLKGESFALAFSPSFTTWNGGEKPVTEAVLEKKISPEIKTQKQEPPEKDAGPDEGAEEKEPAGAVEDNKQAEEKKVDTDVSAQEEASITVTASEEETAAQNRDEEQVSNGEAVLVYDSARELMEQGKYREAIATLRYFTKTYPQHARADDASYFIGECYYNLADQGMFPSYQPAVNALQLALALYPDSAHAPRGFLQLAHALRLMGHFYEAVESYQLLMDKHPQAECIEDVHFWLAESLFQNDDYAKAQENFGRFIMRYPNSALLRQATFRVADCLVGEKEFEKARELYAQAWSRWPDYYGLFGETIYGMGQCSLKHNEYARARSQFFMAFNLFPAKPYNHIVLAKIGDAYRLEGKLDEALKVYAQNRSIHPDTRGALISTMRMADMGVTNPGFFNYDEYLEPLKVYSEIIEENPVSDLAEKALYRQGNLLSEQKRYEEAIVSLMTVLTDYPDSALSKKCALSVQDNLIKLIDAHFQSQSYYPIIEIYGRYSNPFLGEINNSKTLFEIGESFRRTGLTEKSLELFEKARRIYPPNHPEDEIMLRMGELYLEHKSYQKAEDLFNKVIDRFPASPYYKYARHNLGDVHFEQGHYDEAVHAYRSALEGEVAIKRDLRSLYCLGKCFEQRGEMSKAIEAYQRAIKTDERLGGEQTDGDYALKSFLTLGDCYYQGKQYRDAIAVYTQAVKRFPQDNRSQWALYRIAASYQKAGVVSSDIESLKQLKTTAPGEPFWGKVIDGKISSLEWEAANRDTMGPVNHGGES